MGLDAHKRAATVRSLLGDVAGAEILELGAGAGFYTRELIAAEGRAVWAVDLCAAMLASLPAGPITPVLGDAATVGSIDVSRHGFRWHDRVRPGSEGACVRNAAGHAETGALFIILVPRRVLRASLSPLPPRSRLRDSSFRRGWFAAAPPAAAGV